MQGRYLSYLLWNTVKRIGVTPKAIAKLTGRGNFTGDQIALLELMRRDNRLSDSPFTPTAFWSKLDRRFEDWFYWEGIGKVEEQGMNEFFSSPQPRDPKLLRYSCWLLYQHVKSCDRFDLLSKIPATVSKGSGLSFEFEGNLISWDLLISIDTVYSIYEVRDNLLTEPVVILDLGAGWGRIGYVLKMANPQCTYVICDLPEALMVSSTYLPRLLPHETVYRYPQNGAAIELSRSELLQPSIRFYGTHHLPTFQDKSIDVLINIGSFQEMTQRQVEEYFAVVDRKVKGTFYTLQLWESGTHKMHDVISGFSRYPFYPNWMRHYVRNAAWSDLYFEAAFAVP
jgi:putative sugar O-methyltransferase